MTASPQNCLSSLPASLSASMASRCDPPSIVLNCPNGVLQGSAASTGALRYLNKCSTVCSILSCSRALSGQRAHDARRPPSRLLPLRGPLISSTCMHPSSGPSHSTNISRRHVLDRIQPSKRSADLGRPRRHAER
ncbi:hypothetical protein BV20DRAFT_715823 [Pilatotrama ljubarskyi]|nr:hypothetical protein BV20DRAFT_715823 [Pilatotrama ljubarskyi]